MGKNITFDTTAVYTAVERRVQQVVTRAGRIALGSARERAPVRKVFVGGRQRRPEFYTLPQAKAALPAFLRTEPRQPTGELLTRQEGLSQLQATQIRTDRNKANNWQKTGQRSHKTPGAPAPREVTLDSDTGEFHLTDRSAEFGLTTRGKWELNNGRAISTALGAKSRRAFQNEAEVEHFKRSDDEDVQTLGGALRRSIHSENRGSDRGPKVSIVAGGEDAPYARFVEFGTRHAAAQPFLRPALKQVEGPYKAMMRAAFPGSR